MKPGRVGVFVIAMLLATASAFAGHPQKRDGFWFGLGLGYGSAGTSADCDDCGGDRESGLTGFFKLGGTLSPKVLLGAETNVWFKDEDDVTLTLGSVTGTVTFYPQAQGGVFLKGGVGFSIVDWSTTIGATDFSVSKTGWGVMAGIGYDVRIGSNLSLTPSINYWYGKPGDLDFDDGSLPGWKQNVVSFDLGLTFH